MYREDIEEDLKDHYSKLTLGLLADYLGFKDYSKLDKETLIGQVLDGFYDKTMFDNLMNRLSYEFFMIFLKKIIINYQIHVVFIFG